MGTEARLRIMQLLMTAEPNGLVVGDIQSELDKGAPTALITARGLAFQIRVAFRSFCLSQPLQVRPRIGETAPPWRAASK